MSPLPGQTGVSLDGLVHEVDLQLEPHVAFRVLFLWRTGQGHLDAVKSSIESRYHTVGQVQTAGARRARFPPFAALHVVFFVRSSVTHEGWNVVI